MAVKSRKKSEKKRGNKGKTGKLYLQNIFDIFCVWMSMPTLLKGEQEAVLKKLGIDDQELLDLFQIRFKGDFAKRYNLNKDTLVKWTKKIEDENLIAKNRAKWSKHWMSNVMTAVYRKALSEGDSNRAKFLAQFVEGWKESSEISNPEMKEVTDLLRKIAERRK